MALYRTEAVVLKGADWGEADRIVTLLTPDFGKVRAVARGARRPRSRLGGSLLPYAHVTALLWRGRTLDGISQVELRHAFRPLREDLTRLAYAGYACELSDALTAERQEARRPFRLLLSALHLLSGPVPPETVIHAFELRLLAAVGFEPLLRRCAGCGGLPRPPLTFHPAEGGVLCAGCAPRHPGGLPLSRGALEVAAFLLRAEPRELRTLRIDRPTAESLREVLSRYVDHILERRLNSRTFLDMIREVPREV